MSLIFFIHSGAASNVVALPTSSLITSSDTGTVFSGLKFDDDGNLYKRQAGGGYSVIDAWLLSGTASDFTLVSVLDVGDLSSGTDAGRSVILGTDRAYDVTISAPGSITATVTYDIELTADPGVSLANQTYIFRAIRVSK